MLEALQGYSRVGAGSNHAQQQQGRRRRLYLIGGGIAFLLVLLSGGHYARTGSATYNEYLDGVAGKASSSLFQPSKKVKVLHLIDKATEESTMDRYGYSCSPRFRCVAERILCQMVHAIAAGVCNGNRSS